MLRGHALVHEAHGTRNPVNKNRSGSGVMLHYSFVIIEPLREKRMFLAWNSIFSVKSSLNMKYVLCQLENRKKEKCGKQRTQILNPVPEKQASIRLLEMCWMEF